MRVGGSGIGGTSGVKVGRVWVGGWFGLSERPDAGNGCKDTAEAGAEGLGHLLREELEEQRRGADGQVARGVVPVG